VADDNLYVHHVADDNLYVHHVADDNLYVHHVADDNFYVHHVADDNLYVIHFCNKSNICSQKSKSVNATKKWGKCVRTSLSYAIGYFLIYHFELLPLLLLFKYVSLYEADGV